MEKQDKEIELRSEKVREIIGQIPPIIIRIGISILFVVIAILLLGSIFFDYEYVIKSKAIIKQENDSTIIILKVAANEIDMVKPGQKVLLIFDNLPNLYNEIVITKIQSMPNVVEISETGGFYNLEITDSKNLVNEGGRELKIKDEITVNSEIITDKISFFDRIIKPFKILFNKG